MNKSGSAIWRFLASCRDLSERDRRNSWRASAWAIAWAVSFAVAVFVIRKELVAPGWATYAVVLVPTLLAVVTALAFTRLVREADELQRKIQLEALGIGFGGGFVVSYGIELLQIAGLADADPSTSFTLMIFFYVVGLLLGARRYA